MILNLNYCQFEVFLRYRKAKDTCCTMEVLIQEEIKDSTNEESTNFTKINNYIMILLDW